MNCLRERQTRVSSSICWSKSCELQGFLIASFASSVPASPTPAGSFSAARATSRTQVPVISSFSIVLPHVSMRACAFASHPHSNFSRIGERPHTCFDESWSSCTNPPLSFVPNKADFRAQLVPHATHTEILCDPCPSFCKPLL